MTTDRVACEACDRTLTEALLENAVEASERYDGFVMCGACRDAADLQRRLDFAVGTLRQIAQGAKEPAFGAAVCLKAMGVELAPASTTEEASDG